MNFTFTVNTTESLTIFEALREYSNNLNRNEIDRKSAIRLYDKLMNSVAETYYKADNEWCLLLLTKLVVVLIIINIKL